MTFEAPQYDVLKAQRRWVLVDDSGSKEPLRPMRDPARTIIRAKFTNSDVLLTYDEAVRELGRERDGHTITHVGFVFLPGDKIIGIDFDFYKASPFRDTAIEAFKWIECFGEYSRSGNGAHILGYANPAVIDRLMDSKVAGILDCIEIYWNNQYFIMSGNPLPTKAAFGFADLTETVQLLISKHNKLHGISDAPRPVDDPLCTHPVTDTRSVDEVMARLRRAKSWTSENVKLGKPSVELLFSDLEYSSQRYKGWSEAEYDLSRALACVTQDPNMMLQLFRKSVLHRGHDLCINFPGRPRRPEDQPKRPSYEKYEEYLIKYVFSDAIEDREKKEVVRRAERQNLMKQLGGTGFQ
ncbi:hypothetical protein [Neoaquamicrobium sediminum]|uniref:hypothetical protein n=1 Tax=Neoaquamicrobium sediminum TaxID=1849104 RepID=UPI00403520B2